MLKHMDVIGCTIFSRAYLSHARVVARSFRQQYPDAPFYALLCDKVEGAFDPAAEPFTMLTAEDLGIADFKQMAFRYETIELCTAVKPFFLRHLLNATGAEKIFFLDPDIMVTSRLEEAEEMLKTSAIVLTPHLTQPAEMSEHMLEQVMLQVGQYNLGFIGIRSCDVSRRILEWWGRNLSLFCYDRRDEGLFVDQKWMDLAPVIFEGVGILRDTSYNVANWNLHERVIGRAADVWTVNGKPLRFFHFSGYNALKPQEVSRNNKRVSFDQRPDLTGIFDEYRSRQLREGYESMHAVKNAYSFYDNGVPIHPKHRKLFDTLRLERDFGDPFVTAGPDTFYRYIQKMDTQPLATLGRRHTWEPYQQFINGVKNRIGEERFHRIKNKLKMR